MGLREAKKQQLRLEIQQVAIGLFRERGIDETRVRDIIEQVHISEATFFNYFPSKAALLDEWALGPLGLAGVVFSSEGGPIATAGIRRQIRELVRELGGRIEADRAFLSEVWPRLRMNPPTSTAPPLTVEVVERFRAAQTRGEIRADVPPEQLAELLVGVVQHTVAGWLGSMGEQRESLITRLLRAVDLLLDGCRKRNERVRARGVARSIGPAAVTGVAVP